MKTTTAAADGEQGKVSWFRLFGYRQTLAFCAGKFMTDGIWWFYLFWLPDYLNKQFGMTKQDVMLPTFIVYGVAILGSIYGGSIPMTLIKKGMPVYKARMLAMFLIALCPLVVLSTQYFGNVDRFGKMAVVLAVAMICVGGTAHQAWSANLFTTVLRHVSQESRRFGHGHRHRRGRFGRRDPPDAPRPSDRRLPLPCATRPT